MEVFDGAGLGNAMGEPAVLSAQVSPCWYQLAHLAALASPPYLLWEAEKSRLCLICENLQSASRGLVLSCEPTWMASLVT